MCKLNEYQAVTSQAKSFQQISQILDVTDALMLARERMEIPLPHETPGLVRRLSNGKLENILDAGQLFDERRTVLPSRIHYIQGS